jgi:hypothetical protein
MHIGFGWESQKEKSPLQRPRRKWSYIIKMDIRELRWGGIDWTDLAQDRDHWLALVNTVMSFRVA